MGVGCLSLIQEAPQITRQWVGVLHPPTGRGSTVDYTGLKNNWTCLEDLFSFDPENAWLKNMQLPLLQIRNVKSGRKKGLHHGLHTYRFPSDFSVFKRELQKQILLYKLCGTESESRLFTRVTCTRRPPLPSTTFSLLF